MYNTSSGYAAKVTETSRQFKARVSIGETVLQREIRQLTVITGSCGAENFTVGVVFASYADIVLTSTEVSLAGKEIFIEIGLLLSDNTVEYVPMGYFTIHPEELSVTNDMVSFKARDRIATKCNDVYVPSIAFPATIKSVLDDVGNQAGITIETDLDTSGVVQMPMKGLLNREVLGYIAGLLGGFCYSDRDGKIKLRTYPVAAIREVEAKVIIDVQTSESAYTVDTVMVKVSEDGTDADGNDVKGISYISGSGNGNKLIVSNPYMTQALFDAMAEQVLGYTYHPGSVTFLGDPRLGPEDAVCAHNYDGQSYVMPCMSLVQAFDGGLTTTIAAPGKALSGVSAQGPLTQQISRINTEIILAKYVISTKISADEVAAKYATIENLSTTNASITNLSGELASFKNLTTEIFTAINGQIESLTGDYAGFKIVVADHFTAADARIENLSGEFVSFKNGEFEDLRSKQAEFENVTSQNFVAVNVLVQNLASRQITTEYLEANFAKIDFANITSGSIKTAMIDVGAVKTAQIADGSITDAKIVDLTANKITAGMLSVERLEIRGSENSIVYALNNITGALQAQNVETLNGEVLTERTITADKIVADAITANEIAAKSITANEIAANTITAAEIMAQTIVTENLALDAIKSLNYVKDVSGSFLNLADGSFDSVYTKWDAEGKLTVTDVTINNGRIVINTTGPSDKDSIIKVYAGNSVDEMEYSTTIYSDRLLIQKGQSDMGGLLKAIFNYEGIDIQNDYGRVYSKNGDVFVNNAVTGYSDWSVSGKFQELKQGLDKKLPLSGGTMTGSVKFSTYSQGIIYPLSTGEINLTTMSNGSSFNMPYIENDASSWTYNYLTINPGGKSVTFGEPTHTLNLRGSLYNNSKRMYPVVAAGTISCGNLAAGAGIYKEVNFNANAPYPMAIACGTGDNVIVSYTGLTTTKCGLWIKTRANAVTDVSVRYMVFDLSP